MAKSKWIENTSPDQPVAEVAERAIAGRLEAVWHYLPLAAEDSQRDMENVHQMRVATRRAKAALHIFEALLPPRRLLWMDKQLKRVRRAAGDARDLDVMAGRFARLAEERHDAAYQTLLDWIRAQRDRAQKPIEKVFARLRRKDFPRRAAALVKRVRLRTEPDKQSQPTFASAARTELRGRLERFFQSAAADLHDLAALHAFRIQGKQLRYAMEIFAGAFGPAFRQELYPQLEALQEKLGEINDHATAAERFEAWRSEFDDPAVKQALAQLVGEERAAVEQSREQFLAWWTAERRDQLQSRFCQTLSV